MPSATQAIGMSTDPIREAALVAFSRLIEPILILLLDTGITASELNQIIREGLVSTARQIAASAGTSSKSHIAILCGLSRSEVARLLGTTGKSKSPRRPRHPLRRVLSGWHEDVAFLDQNGEPQVLSIFGPKKSLEKLVKKYGGGVPVRAMLDELTRINAVELLEGQRVKAKSRNPTSTGLSPESVSMIGEKGRDLLSTLIKNARGNGKPLFEATAWIDDPNASVVSMVRREIADQGGLFVDSIDSLLRRANTKQGRTHARDAETTSYSRLGVSAFYFEEAATTEVEDKPLKGNKRARRNLRRK